MDTLDDHSNPTMDNSQPTQLLRNVLRGSTDKKSSDTNSSLGEHLPPRHVSSDSLHASTRDSNPAPRYHYYGLASTQTQTQHCDDNGNNQNSQKENLGTSGDIRPVITYSISSSSTSPHPSSSKSSVKEQTPHGGQQGHPLSRLTEIKLKATTTKVATLQRATASQCHIETAGAQWRNMPSRSPSTGLQTVEEFSQDSFAGPLSQDPVREFLATSKEFEVPLSELGRDTQETGSGRPTGVPEQSSSDFDTPDHPHDRSIPDSSPILGNVLVEATPSDSDSSQIEPSEPPKQQPTNVNPNTNLSSGRHPPTVGKSNPANRDADAPSQGSSDTSSELSSSYERYLSGKLDPVDNMNTQPAGDYVATQPSTQPAEDYVATQPSTQLETSTSNNGDLVARGSGDQAGQRPDSSDINHPWVAPVAHLTSDIASTSPRSIVRMIDPRKPWRVRKYMEDTLSPVSGEGEGRGVTSEVQPASEDVVGGTRQAVVDSGSRSPHQVAGPSRNKGQATSGDDANVIPDPNQPLSDPKFTSAPLSVHVKSANERLDPRLIKQVRHPIAREHNPGEIAIPVLEREESEEDEVPLAATTSKRAPSVKASKVKTDNKRVPRKISAKGKEPAEMVIPRGKPIRGSRAPRGVSTAVRDPRPRPHPVAAVSAQVAEVPPPVLEENLGLATTNSKVKRAQKINADSHAAPVTIPSDRRARSRSTTSSKRQRSLAETPSQNDAPSIRKADEDEETDLADEDYVDPNLELEDEPGSSRKRKRGNAKARTKAKRPRPALRITTTAGKLADPPLLDKESKRLRSFASVSTSRTATGPATRVFALWKQDGHFYPGTVHSLQSGTKYLIKFDDGTEDEVDILRMRLHGLREGDNVILVDTNETAEVVDDTRIESDEIIRVAFHNGDELERMDVETSDIRIAARTISSKWGDRVLTPEAITTVVRQKPLKPSSSLSKFSISSITTGKDGRRKTLLKTGIAITLTPKYNNQQGDRAKLASIIKSNGGTVIDDWFSLIRMDGDYGRFNKQWVAHAKDVRWIGKQSLQRVFLLADDPSAKPKYLIALALGIPCLSLSWLHDLVQSGEKDWQPYLLPQGTSIALNARVSQFVDWDWCNSPEHLVEIMSKNNKVASRLFEGKSILCLGEAFVPDAKRKKAVSDSDMTREASGAVPRIILAMGATRVEAAADLPFTSNLPSTFDYVVAQDPPPDLGIGVNVVNVEWVKDCLVSRRLTKLPGYESDDNV